jgi:hypothetical protein
MKPPAEQATRKPWGRMYSQTDCSYNDVSEYDFLIGAKCGPKDTKFRTN